MDDVLSPATRRRTRAQTKATNVDEYTTETVLEKRRFATTINSTGNSAETTFEDFRATKVKSELVNGGTIDENSPVKKKTKTEHVSVKVEQVNNSQESVPLPSDSPNVFLFADPKDTTENAPPEWVSIYNEVVKMRSKFMSPVDHHGCVMMPETLSNTVKNRDPQTYRFQLLISLMLSAQTKDEVNFQAMNTLHQNYLSQGYKNGLCLQAILDSTETYIDECIAKVGFHRKKASYIKRSCELIREKFNDDIPKSIEEIVLMPGVGPKMGYLVLQLGWGINHGIGVDVHIHRLAKMWGWVSKKVKTPEQTRLELQDWLPEKYWVDLNPLLVGFGQTVCAPNANNCDVCTLSTSGLCKVANRKLMKTPISPKRLLKLKKQRSDLSPLVPVHFNLKEEIIDTKVKNVEEIK